MSLFLVAVVTLVVSVIYTSVFEWVLHKYIMHRPLGPFRYPFEAHGMVHHRLFKADGTYHVGGRGPEVRDKIPMAWWNGPVIVLIGTVIGPLPIAAALYWFGWPQAAVVVLVVSLLVFIVYFSSYEYLHWCMHAAGSRWFERTRIFRRLNGHHILHHRYMSSNFNTVLPLADWLFGTLLMRAKRPFAQVQGPSIPNVQP